MSEIEYARAGDGTHVAFRVLAADTPRDPGSDIVMVSGGLIPMELFDDDPGFVRLLEGLRALGRVVVFDRRGTGLSDPIVDWDRPILDQWADDLAAVVDASRVHDPVVFAWDGYGIASRFAAAHPDRLSQLVLHQPLSIPDDAWDDWVVERLRLVSENLEGGRDELLEKIAPSRAADPSFREWYTRAGRAGASPATASRIWEAVFVTRPGDQLLDQVEVPTLVLHRRDNTYSPRTAVQRAAACLRAVTVVELPGADHFPFAGDVDAVVAEVAAFHTGERSLPPPQRLLAALMFTDLVASTAQAAALGDARWKSVLDRHDAVVRAAVGRSGGTVVKNTGDGVLALLPSAGVAVQVARRVRDELAAEALAVRIGLHVGDVDRRGADLSGLGVHVAARVMAVGGSGEIIVTGSLRIAVTGETATFEPLGPHALRGVPGEWELFRLVA